ncbi:ArnT family glycosyltransferase [Tengunoibacter tsumagoiensis]|uniref:Dolichyl-phosphate-mannose--protein mannosyltransferase n=1 Tax=Tengunoibacter tsumagoiensis TaxID=2014871 RepID=A0A401ZVQ4_9CHLR|nr:glycosyltransferase family 39 protein [Tengunoibacter tsumagoiensis]GCE10981.1 dolichyl-phosphate-mannose--protein mannosyltransferase [Tengunoibacter tsumagoiensis]
MQIENLPALPASLPDSRIPVRADHSMKRWHQIALGIIVALSAVLNFVQIQQNGYGNSYYAAAVRSMLLNWHNFFFVSFDPGGFVTVDKPPLGLWIQACSAWLFQLCGSGFSSISLLVPQALAGTISVALLFVLVRRFFGPIGGLLAALALAITPISVVMSRDNNLDTLLVFTMLLATWAVCLAVETGRLRWLLLCAVFIGLGFNIKTLEAYLFVPAFGLFYLLCTSISWRKRLIHLSLAIAVMLVVSFAWLITVDLTPVSQRPYVGSSQTNSELELALGYNGIQRLTGMNMGRGRAQNSGSGSQAQSQTVAMPAGSPLNEGGPPSPLRMFKVDLGGQVSWLLPMALFGLLAAAWQTRARWRLPLTRKQQALPLWGVWLLTMGIFFSIASFFHSYYLTIIAPAIAALAAGAFVLLWHDYRERTDWRRWALPVALIATAAEQVYLIASYEDYTVLWVVVLLLCAISALILVLAQLPFTAQWQSGRWSLPALQLAAIAVLLTPLVWSILSIQQPSNAVLPTGGPALAQSGMNGLFRAMGDRGSATQNASRQANNFLDEKTNPKLLKYLEENQGTTTFLFATQNATSAAPYIIETGQPVMAMGGFLGSDPILTLDQLKALIKRNEVRFFLLPSFNLQNLPANLPEQIREMLEQGGGGPFGGSQLTQWVNSSCKVVDNALWQATTENTTGSTPESIPGVGAGLPGGSLPPGGLPGGSLPPGGLPGGSLPPGGLPGGSLPPGGLPGSSQGGFPGSGFGAGMMGQQLFDCSSV